MNCSPADTVLPPHAFQSKGTSSITPGHYTQKVTRAPAMSTNPQSSTHIDEIADGIYRINTPISIPGGQFSFNQYLIVDELPMLFHTGPRQLFAPVQEAINRVVPVQSLRYLGLSHFEADECGSLNA